MMTRLRHPFVPMLALLLAHAGGCDEPQWHPSLGGEEYPQIGVTPLGSWLLAEDDAPAGATALDSSTIAFLSADRTEIWLLAGAERSRVTVIDSDSIRAITGVGKRLWYVVADSLMELDMEIGGAATRVFSFETIFDAIALTTVNGSVFAVGSRGDVSRLFVLRPGLGPSLTIQATSDFGGAPYLGFPWADDSAFLQQAHFPFQGFEISTEGTVGRSLLLDQSGLARLGGEEPGIWVLGANLRLDSDHVLLWYNSPTSINRLAVLTSFPTGAILRATLVESPLGFVHQVPGHPHYVLGSLEVKAGRYLVLYRLGGSSR